VTTPDQEERSPIREVLTICMKDRYRAPRGVVVNSSGELAAAGSADVGMNAAVMAMVVGVGNAAAGIGFSFLATETGVVDPGHRIVLFIGSIVWGLLIGSVALLWNTSQSSTADRKPTLLRVNGERLESLNADWVIHAEELEALIAWKLVPRDRGAHRSHLRLELLTAATKDGRHFPIFATRLHIDRTRDNVRKWCKANDLPLREYSPREEDRPWLVEVPVELQTF
jgi:hypothetical protein